MSMTHCLACVYIKMVQVQDIGRAKSSIDEEEEEEEEEDAEKPFEGGATR